MKIRHIRNATLLIEYGGVRFLTDPWFAAKGADVDRFGVTVTHRRHGFRRRRQDFPSDICDTI